MNNSFNSEVGLNVKKSAAAWLETIEAQNFFEIFDNVSHSEEAQRLQSYGEALGKNVSLIYNITKGMNTVCIPNGAHINNDALESRLQAIKLELNHIHYETSFLMDVEAAYRNTIITP